jgi:ABC-type transporter Mla MlaB component
LTFRIHRSRKDGAVTFVLSGEVTDAAVAELTRLLELEATDPLVLDLADVTRVDRDAVTFLGCCLARGIRLVRCPHYIVEWIKAEGARASHS